MRSKKTNGNLKQCSDCKEWKALDQFRLQYRYRSSYCNDCAAIRKKDEQDGKRECKICHERRPLIEFKLMKKGRGHICCKCRMCNTEPAPLREVQDWHIGPPPTGLPICQR